MHGEAVGVGSGLGVSPAPALAYAMGAGFLYLLSRTEETAMPAASAVTHEAMAPAE
jgi:AGZA family xanthine/uracil permease-like MFS transporter